MGKQAKRFPPEVTGIANRLRMRIALIPKNWQHTCSAACTHADCLIVGAAAELDRLRRELKAAQGVTVLYEEADADNQRLRDELETERMRLVACGVVAMADTPESSAQARDMLPAYRSASCEDVARRVDECMSLRRELAEARELAKIARQVCDSTEGTQHRTDCIASMRAYLTIRMGAATPSPPTAAPAPRCPATLGNAGQCWKPAGHEGQHSLVDWSASPSPPAPERAPGSPPTE